MNDKPVPFEEVIENLKNIVMELEKGELSLDQSMKVFERGIHFAREGTRQLDEAEKKVEELIHENSPEKGSSSVQTTMQGNE